MLHRSFQVNHLSSLVTIVEVLLYESQSFEVEYPFGKTVLTIKDQVTELVEKRLKGEIEDGYIKELTSDAG